MKLAFAVAILSLVVLCASVGRAQVQMSDQGSASRADSSYGDFSEKEDCIHNYARSCGERNIDRFAELFQTDCQFIYIIGKPDSDASVLPNEMLRKHNLQKELEATGQLFAAARDLHLEIENGTWTRLDSLSGNPCSDCWETTRGYSLSATFPASGEGEEPHVMSGHGHMKFIVSPVDGKWKILRHIDQPIDKKGDQ